MVFRNDGWRELLASGAIVLALAGGQAAAAPLTATSPADPNKVIHAAFVAADDGFDVARTYNAYSIWVAESIFEPLLTYDYLARPAKLVPLTATAMPEVADGGKTYIFHIKPGIYFTPDPAFGGKPRELTAKDYVYTFERLEDPAIRSPSANMLSGKIVGLDALAARARKTGHFDYDAPVAGLTTPDRYTLKVQLTHPDFNFLYVTAYPALGAVAREAIAEYGAQSGAHPVGTGPYQLSQYVPRSKIVLTANPYYRGYVWNFKSTGSAWDDQLVRDMRGKRMPQVGRVEISIIEEDQSRWLAFQGGQLDLVALPQSAAPIVMDGDRLKPEYAKQGIRLYRQVLPEITYTLFNLHDPVLGGYSPAKIALRRAIAMSYDLDKEIRLIRQNQAVRAEMIVPEGVVGHDPNYRSSIPYDRDLANRLLDHFGYKRGADGYRKLPDGRPLVVHLTQEPDSLSRQYGELWKRGLDKIGLRLNITVSNFADNLKAATQCKLAMWQAAWSADYPEAENFLQLLYGPNTSQGNNGCYESAAFDALYKQFRATPPGEARNALVIEMNRQEEADTPWALGISPVSNWLVRPWVEGFKRHPIMESDWQYLDVVKH
ncbi:periplasmic oligopeptide-binding protein precursor [mine drainage metagenome]|uniref:Periplasmic oligopeptide-binding protein n=1 Tax=mine drainage metagenome TaxID=410659 RepID=A0A1J5R120_9ZZZZ